jgi:RHS repeat-associated protein
VQRIDYDEFGNVTYDSNPGFQPFGFTRGMYESDCGLVFLGARAYDPEAGRWLSPYPIGFAASETNLYNYVLSDPVNNNDPTGLDGNNWVWGEIGPYINISQRNLNPNPGLADAKASIIAACSRNPYGCYNKPTPGPNAARGDRAAWQNIVNATGGTDRSGGGNYICVGSQECSVVHECNNSRGETVERPCRLQPTGTVTIGGITIYFYSDPHYQYCPDQD